MQPMRCRGVRGKLVIVALLSIRATQRGYPTFVVAIERVCATSRNASTCFLSVRKNSNTLTGMECKIEQHTRTALEQQQWTIVVNDVCPLPLKASFVELWKMYANGVAVKLSIQDEQGQFALYADVGHAAAGTNRIQSGRFSTLNDAVAQLIQECAQYDSAWET